MISLKTGFWWYWQRVTGRLAPVAELVAVEQERHLLGGRFRLPVDDQPLQFMVGKRDQGTRVLLCPEGLMRSGDHAVPRSHVLVAPARPAGEIFGTLRLAEGDELVLGRDDPEQQLFFDWSGAVSGQHLSLARRGDHFIFSDLSVHSGVCLSAGPAVGCGVAVGKMARLRAWLGGSFQYLSRSAALDVVQAATTLLEQDPCQPRNDRGEPGGVVLLPEQMTPIVVGDLHGQVDNLLKILLENQFMEALESGRACLLFLGDFVHSEEDGQLERMESSLLMMDWICQLKIRFPGQVFFIKGNHDSFSEGVFKGGVCQGLLWKKAVLERGGPGYLEAMARFYALMPFVALGRHFVACHAAPPRGSVTLDMLINIYKYPGLGKELMWNRVRRPGHPAGYGPADVVRWRRSLQVKPDTPFLVGHNPLSRDVSVWLHAGQIRNHHIVFSGLTGLIGWMTCVKERLVAQVCLAEPGLNAMLERVRGGGGPCDNDQFIS